jgi:hypothetical protein
MGIKMMLLLLIILIAVGVVAAWQLGYLDLSSYLPSGG